MKHFLLILAIGFVVQSTYAQCTYVDESDAPKELALRRLKDHLAGFRYGHPYTMFNRHEHSTWTLDGALTPIKNNIYAGTPITGQTFRNDYAKLYADLWRCLSAPQRYILKAIYNFVYQNTQSKF